MASLYYRPTTGVVERIDRTEEVTARYGPADPALTRLDLDGPANAALLDSLHGRRDSYRVSGGVLTRDGRPVTIAPAPPETAESALIRGELAGRDDLDAEVTAALAAIDAATSLAQLRPLFRQLVARLARINRRLAALEG